MGKVPPCLPPQGRSDAVQVGPDLRRICRLRHCCRHEVARLSDCRMEDRLPRQWTVDRFPGRRILVCYA